MSCINYIYIDIFLAVIAETAILNSFSTDVANGNTRVNISRKPVCVCYFDLAIAVYHFQVPEHKVKEPLSSDQVMQNLQFVAHRQLTDSEFAVCLHLTDSEFAVGWHTGS